MNFWQEQDVAQKLQKPNNTWRKWIYLFRGLRVKAQVANVQEYAYKIIAIYNL